jgi:PAS domain S-box-containing protein
MFERLRRLRTWRPGPAGGLADDLTGAIAGLLTLGACVAADVALSNQSAAIVGTFVAAPFFAAMLAGPVVTAGIALLAFGAALASPIWNADSSGAEQAVRLIVIGLGGALAVGGAWLREHWAGRSERLRLLDSVGAVADGSLPLAETLRRVTDVVVPTFADICIIDAIREGGGRASRIAVRAGGDEDAQEFEDRLRRRPPALPEWLVRGERSWRHLPQWRPHVGQEELRRMAISEDDLEFLRRMDPRSWIVIPIRARGRNLGALTLITAWSRRVYDAEDVRFGEILASRIGLALDNAGLFSDLESIERRMDTVMSILDEAILIQGADGELVFANPAAARMLGYETSQDAVSAPTAATRQKYSIRDERGNEVAPEALAGRRALRGEPPEPQTLRAVNLETGEERWTRTKARAIEGAAGEVLYSVTAIEDVTELKRAEFANRLLARTGELLSHSTDYRGTLERVPQLLVPEFADWCSIEIPRDDGLLQRVAMAHRDPSRLPLLRTLRERYPLRVDVPSRIGDVMRTGEPELIQPTDEWLRSIAADEEHFGLLREIAMGSVISVPMTAAAKVVGALVFVNEVGSRAFDENDLEIAAEVARRAALAIENARIADERARVADALQRELLPPSLPSMPGWEVATMYEPAGEINEVGGDFYEVFPVAGGWAVVLGDVSGKGAAAAAVTAEARYTIRTAGTLAADPVAGLHLLDEALRGRDDVALCSVAMVVLPDEPAAATEVFVYLAGHPHPILLHEGRAEPVGEPGPLLGVVENPTWVPTPVTIGPGDQLVLYTDGVIEARGDGRERFGSQRLRDRLAGAAAPELAVERVRGALTEFGARAREDDAALVAIRRAGSDGDLGLRLEHGVQSATSIP